MSDTARGRTIYWALGALAALIVFAFIGYLSLKLAPDWFESDQFGHTPCRSDSADYKACLEIATASADERRGITTASLALFAGALSAVGAVYTGLTFRENRKVSRSAHELSLEVQQDNRNAVDTRHRLDREALERDRKAADLRHKLDLEAADRERDRQITERFTRAVDQLGSDKRDVRVGGIYALERIAHDSPQDHPQVMEVLTAYLKEHAPWPEPQVSEDVIRALRDEAAEIGPSKPDPAADVQAAIRVIGRRDFARDTAGDRISLSDVDLRGATLRGGHFEDARFRRSNLAGARLEGAHFQGAQLRDARFDDAHLAPDPDLRLPAASLKNASLPSATLIGANLKSVDFAGADLEGARLDRADLRGASFTAARNLDAASLQDAVYDGSTQWPERFDPERAGARAQ
jgi:hypothetical protein